MGRQVRRVPADWQHPKNAEGHYIPLLEGPFAERDAEWMEEWQRWNNGFARSYGQNEKWEARNPKYAHMRYTDYAGARPSPDDFMPEWPEDQRTHLMMYDDTTEGTPISPAFDTPEKLAMWLADNGASSFGRDTATYDQWLAMILRGWAPSAIMVGGQLLSGVAAA